MAKTDLISCLYKKFNFKLSAIEKFLLEMNLIIKIYYELLHFFQLSRCSYDQFVNCKKNEDMEMAHVMFLQQLIQDILATNEYTLAGIAFHTQIPEEVLIDVVAGITVDLAFETFRKIFELHISVRKSLYDKIMHKITVQHLSSMSGK